MAVRARSVTREDCPAPEAVAEEEEDDWVADASGMNRGHEGAGAAELMEREALDLLEPFEDEEVSGWLQEAKDRLDAEAADAG